MKLIYRLGQKKKETSFDNDDLSFVNEEKEEQHIIKVIAKKDIVLLNAVIEEPYEFKDGDQAFLNGYSAWTATKTVDNKYKEMNIYKKFTKLLYKFIPADTYGDYFFHKYKRNCIHGYDVFFVKGNNPLYILSNNYKNAYLIIELDKKKKIVRLTSDVEHTHLKAGEEFTIFDYVKFGSFEKGEAYFNKKHPLLNKEKILGYTSWYNYYQNINEEIILRDLDALDSRFQLFQIDDGYETYVGDWLDVDPKKFPNGLEPIVKKIHEKGLKAGLWLAPFVAETESKLFKTRPELFKKDKHGKPLRTGVGWSGQYSLDIEKEEAVKYIKTCLKHYLDMGFDFFKLDFLYAINNGKNSYSRASISEKGYQLLRDILGDKLILGCGAIPSSSIHHFDYIRVGMDLTLDYEGGFYDKIKPCYEYPSTRNTLQNTIYRSFMGQRLFGNDPDVFLLRDDNTSLSLEQRRSVTTINALFGDLLMCSDNIATYNEEQKKILENCLDIFRNATNKKYVLDNDIIHIQYELKGQKHYFDFNVKEGLLFTKE